MSDRVCVRGCTQRGVHFAACPDFGKSEGGECRGCAPAEARDGALVCQRCYQRMRYTLDVLPDVVSLIRSRADPLKAAVYDREQVTGGGSIEAPAPVAADLIDASDFVVEVLRAWESRSSGRGLVPGADAEQAHNAVLAIVLGIDLEGIANNADAVLVLWADLFDIPEDDDAWSIARAVARWPLEDRSYWAAQPCPECSYKTVKVTPPRRANRDTTYRCSTCKWEAFDRDAVDDDGDGFWFEVFSRKAGQAA